MIARDPAADRPVRPALTRLADRADVVRRALLRRRRPLAVALVAVATLAGLRVAAPPPPATTPVLVAARDLPSGAVLGEDDVRRVAVPDDLVPDGVADDPVGRTLAAPVSAGEAVTDVRLVGPALAASTPGTVALPVRLSDADQATLLGVGDRIDLLATAPDGSTSETVADHAVVLALPEPAAAGSGALAGRVVVLAVPAPDVDGVTSAAVASFVTFAWANH